MKLAEQGHCDESQQDASAILRQWFDSETCSKLGVLDLPDGFLLSVIIPVFNEAETVRDVITRVRETELPCEIIVVDDGSTDGTRDVLSAMADQQDLRIVFQRTNQGKGAALKAGFELAEGTLVVIQDGDLEYDPADLRLLIGPIVEGLADVVYGSRFGYTETIVSSYLHQRGNQTITRLSNWSTGLKLTDVETCYKIFRRELLQQITPTLREKGFGIELEMTAKLARLPGIRFAERPISYQGRSYAQGKKIGWRDAIWAMWCILRY